MPGLSLILETARRALMSQQVGINVTSHNIANASTPGYSRQRVSLTTTPAIHQTYGYLGTGVQAESVGRLRDAYLDQQIRSSNGTMGSASAQQGVLSQVEASFNEPSDAGLSSVMSQFFNSWQDLATHPEDSSSRNSVIQQGVLVSQSFQRLHSELTQIRDSLTDDVKVKISSINQLTSEISDLNNRIVTAAAAGGDPSDLQDQRDQKIEDLSSLANIAVSIDSGGSANVSIGGMTVASRGGSIEISAEQVGSQLQIFTTKDHVQVNLTGGELGGDLKLYNTTISGYLAKLDELAGAFIDHINTLHRAGYGLGTPPSTGVDFFSGTGAADIGVNAAVVSNPSLVAASQDGTPGDNSVALAIANATSDKVLTGNTLTLSQFYNGLASSVGSDINAVDSTANSQQLILAQLENQRQSVSGVSLDEEMTNLIQYQRAYDAAARLVNTANQMFQTVLDMVA
ncbi:MAG: flagellar hook-associated protein FlgK [Bacteroidota bacterium]